MKRKINVVRVAVRSNFFICLSVVTKISSRDPEYVPISLYLPLFLSLHVRIHFFRSPDDEWDLA